MDTMRKSILLACCLVPWIYVVRAEAAVPAKPNAATASVSRVGVHAPRGTVLLSEDQSAYVFPLPPTARVVGHATDGVARGEGTCPDEANDKLIYSNLASPAPYMVYRPPIAYTRIADDIFTNAVGTCEIHKYAIRVNGGVVDGWFSPFHTTVALTTYCPSLDYWGPTIPGTELRFTRPGDINDIWELEVDFCDPNIGICSDGRACRFVDDTFGSGAGCVDGSQCMERTGPAVIPSQVWLRVEFSTNTAGWLVGVPPVVGFSSDRYDHLFTGCNTWFGGYPTHPHASFSAQFYAPATCPTHFLAYLADAGQGVAYTDLGSGTAGQLMADDIELIVDSCELSTLEIWIRGIHGQYEIDFDLRIFPSDNPIPGTEFHWVSDRLSGVGNLEVARLRFDEGVFVPRDFWMTWRANKDDTGLINAGGTQIGGQCRLPDGSACNHYFGWYGPPWAEPGEWNTQVETPDGRDAVFSVAVYCSAEEPTGPCCMAQRDMPGQDPACIDDVPATSCLEGRWLNAEGDPDTIACPASFNLGECEDGSRCNVLDQDCPDSSCCAGHDCRCDPLDPWAQIGQPPCGTHACCKPDNNCQDLPRDECVAILEEDTGHPARWNRGDFCGLDNQRCPFFACYDATLACTECNDPFHYCGSDQAIGDEICKDWLDDPNATCNIVHEVCRIPKACTDVWCCDWVCRIPANQFCCATGWDCVCRAQAEYCPGPPANDDCWDAEPGRGAIEIRLEPHPSYPTLDYRGTANSNHENATVAPDEPAICCFNQGINTQAPGTVWYKFRPGQTGSTRIHTCDWPGNPGAGDSVIQVFAAVFSDIGLCEDGSRCSVSDQDCSDDSCVAGENCVCHDDDERLCQYLEVIACNDDGDASCGRDGRNSDLCIPEVLAGELYYIVVGTSSTDQMGRYKLTIEQPCYPEDIPPTYSYCEGAYWASDGPYPYDLTGTTLDCPAETCLPRMKNDIWFDHHATCTGTLIVRTCDTDSNTPEEDTTLAVYEGLSCPPPPEALLGCNDDAVAGEHVHDILGMPQSCVGIGNDCDDNSDCAPVCTIGHNLCTSDSDCDIGVCYSGDTCSVNSQECNDGLPCVSAEACVPGVCESACSPGSLVMVPVSNAFWYKIRVGGSEGNEPSGELTITCIEDACNIENCPPGEPWCKDCNFNGVLDGCDIFFDPENWKDCQCNYIPDRCEIRFDSSAPGGPFYCVSNCDPDVDDNGVPDVCFVGLRELASLLVCFTGEGGGEIDPGCTNFDADNDGDLDLYDFATLRLTGPGVCQWEPWIDR